MSGKCWVVTGCGREPGGARVSEMGVCPAATESSLDGVNHGDMAGRSCWAVAGTFCGGRVRGTWAEKKLSCMSCSFFKQVRLEEAETFQLLPPA